MASRHFSLLKIWAGEISFRRFLRRIPESKPFRGTLKKRDGICSPLMGKAESKAKARAKHLQDNYNLTVEQSDRIDAHQKNVCWVCGRPERIKGRRLATDHSHIDGLVRGRLCSQCNPLLGKLENAYIRLGLHKVPGLNFVQIVKRLALYVENPPATAALGKQIFGWPGKIGTNKQRKFLRKQAKSAIASKPLIAAQNEAK